MDKLLIQQAIKIAKELLYSEETIERLKKAKSQYEITQILASARKEIRD